MSVVLTITSGVGTEGEGEGSSVDAIVVTVEAREPAKVDSVSVALLVKTPDSVVTVSLVPSVDSCTRSLEEVKPAVVGDESKVDGESVVVNTVDGGNEEEGKGSNDSVVRVVE